MLKQKCQSRTFQNEKERHPNLVPLRKKRDPQISVNEKQGVGKSIHLIDLLGAEEGRGSNLTFCSVQDSGYYVVISESFSSSSGTS